MVDNNNRPRPLALIILDGWGYSEDPSANAILAARKPNWDRIWKDYPRTLIQGSGNYVGLPADQMGNSEVGHLNMGAGRVVYQEITRIDRAIERGDFDANPVLNEALERVAASGRSVHVLGLLSEGGVHSHQEHIHAMLRLAARRVDPRRVHLHAFLDGRDTPPRSASANIVAATKLANELGGGHLASLVGRYFAMDRDNRWERTRLAYELLAEGRAEHVASDPLQALEQAYARGESDEFVRPIAIARDGVPVRIGEGDLVVFMNFRADRARQITRAFVDESFAGFERTAPRLQGFVTLTEYSKEFSGPVAFPQGRIDKVLGEWLEELGMTQLRIAETEKYAHVTFFFDGGADRVFEGEERILVPSPRVATYDLQPEMNAPEVTDRLVEAIAAERFDVIVCNFANADMVGHTGNFEAAVRAIETLDACVGRIYEALRKVGGEMIVTADHGNAERMADEATGQSHTAHTSNPVPFVYVGRPARILRQGALSDIAPTMLYLMGVDKPAEMDGQPLVELVDD
ncbi:MAG: 2,3-bisphosphoglycerate-independent phosphoglycerate mutase [Gammaproteobacteria bacterium]|jgi:2,3-bisphosphoglycerate-independent phosphoglycerate mutase|nr:2,3-bisphosphoglycerate-independent phosphoglycerate mutase [Gammaproteobacteria bacterium]